MVAVHLHSPSTNPESCVRGGPTLTVFFFFFFFLGGGGGGGVDEGREDQNTTIRGPSLACQPNAI